MMLPAAIAFFKRNPKAVACHVVLDQVFKDATAASIYRKAVRAYKVTAYTRAEFEAIQDGPKQKKKKEVDNA